MQSQFIDRRTPSERAVAVEVSESGDDLLVAVVNANPFSAAEGVRASGPRHEHRRRRRPSVLEVVELAIVIAHYKVQVACGRHKTMRSQHIDRRTRFERAIVVEVSESGGAMKTDIGGVEGVRASGP